MNREIGLPRSASGAAAGVSTRLAQGGSHAGALALPWFAMMGPKPAVGLNQGPPAFLGATLAMEHAGPGEIPKRGEIELALALLALDRCEGAIDVGARQSRRELAQE